MIIINFISFSYEVTKVGIVVSKIYLFWKSF